MLWLLCWWRLVLLVLVLVLWLLLNVVQKLLLLNLLGLRVLW